MVIATGLRQSAGRFTAIDSRALPAVNGASIGAEKQPLLAISQMQSELSAAASHSIAAAPRRVAGHIRMPDIVLADDFTYYLPSCLSGEPETQPRNAALRMWILNAGGRMAAAIAMPNPTRSP
jgi:hypothetical protein